MKFIPFSLVACVIVLYFSSCNNKATSSLLSDRQSCSPEDCPESQKAIDGFLSIEADAGAYQLNVDKSDVIEIAGKCSDLGIRQNKIFVQVFEGENTSVNPYIDNQGSVNCTNSTTASINNKRCFWITQGKGVVDSGLEYPQCFNGRFSFSVKLGRILRTTEGVGVSAAIPDDNSNPRRKYLVRFKLSTNNGVIAESAWNSTVIERGVSKPTFSQDSLPLTDYKCDIKINAFKNLSKLTDIKYDIIATPDFILGASGVETSITSINNGGIILPIPYTEPIPSPPLAHVTNYRIFNIIPGVKYRVKVKAYENKYLPSVLFNGKLEESPYSEELECGSNTNLDGRPVLNLISASSTDAATSSCQNSFKKCSFKADLPISLSSSNVGVTNSGFYEWMVIKNMTSWAEDYETGTILSACLSSGPPPGSAIEGCKSTKVLSSTSIGTNEFDFRPEGYPKNTCTDPTTNSYNGNYGVAVRYIDASGLFKGKWSNVVNCVFSK